MSDLNSLLSQINQSNQAAMAKAQNAGGIPGNPLGSIASGSYSSTPGASGPYGQAGSPSTLGGSGPISQTSPQPTISGNVAPPQPSFNSNANSVPAMSGVLGTPVNEVHGASQNNQSNGIPSQPNYANTNQNTVKTEVVVPTIESKVHCPAGEGINKSPEFPFKTGQFTQSIQFIPGNLTLQETINNAQANTCILLPDCTISEEIVISKNIAIKGSGNTVITGPGRADVINVSAPYVHLENLIIKQIATTHGAAITATDGYLNIVKCKITSGSISAIQATQDAIVVINDSHLYGSYNPTIFLTGTSFVFASNTEFTDSKTYGILLNDNTTIHLNKCRIKVNGASGISVTGTSRLYAINTEIIGNGTNGVESTTRGEVLFYGCNISSSKAGAGLFINGRITVSVIQTTFVNNPRGSIRAVGGSTVYSTSNVFNDSGENVELFINDEGYIKSTNDEFTGNCIAAIAACGKGTYVGKNINIHDVTNAGVLGYGGGSIYINTIQFKNCKGGALQIRENSRFEGVSMTMYDCIQYGLLLSDNSSGFALNSKFQSANGIGCEVANVTDFVFRDCEFSNNKVLGLLISERVKIDVFGCQFFNNGNFGSEIRGAEAKPIFAHCRFGSNGYAAVSINEGGNPTFINTQMNNNQKFGVTISGGNPVFKSVEFAENIQPAVSLSNGAKATFDDCHFHDNKSFAIQCIQQGTHAKFTKCFMINQKTSIDIFATDLGAVRCVLCRFSGCDQPHCEISKGAKVSLKDCDLGFAAKGIGIQVHDGGLLKMKGCQVHDENRHGILVGDGGHAKVFHSKFYNNGICGVVTTNASESSFEQCEFENNGDYAVQCSGGHCTVTKSIIKNHRQYGVVVSPGAQLDNVGNTFTNCGPKNVIFS